MHDHVTECRCRCVLKPRLTYDVEEADCEDERDGQSGEDLTDDAMTADT